ncbi:patatin family protein [Alloscardovia theropitheci]|uniref:Patatin family protein n=1 Tax=Alloscardovia theropitheci TaxID=2496842 RepID=A0A4R0QTS2_9BIFI|nr:patatin family protein [Alloscardovia theropitheci]TCD54715.1 patatin family protein [Alloscardovia theropitheci]
MVTGIIDVGGGYRDIFGAGVLDGLLSSEITFDHCYGISAGSGNLSSFLAGQYKRNYRFYVEYAFRHRYASMRNMFKNRNFVGLDYAYGTLSNSDGEYPLNYPALVNNPARFTVIASDATTGCAHYFSKEDLSQDDYSIIMASSCVPVANQPVMIDGVPYYDGGITDPVPVERAFADGCDKVVLITTHPIDFVRDPRKDIAPAQVLKQTYPAIGQALLHRAEVYNAQIELARQFANEGKLLILAPDDTYGLNTLSKTRQGLINMYNDGVEKARLVQEFLEGDVDDE